MATTGKIAEVLFESTLESYEHQMQMLSLVDIFKPNTADMQNAGDVIWRPVQQHAPVINGWDVSGAETDIIEETYPAFLGEPANDFIEQAAYDLRDMRFWERRGEQSGRRQATELNKRLAGLIANTGSLFYRFDTGVAGSKSGYEFIAQAQAIMNERQLPSSDMRYFMLNDRDQLTFSGDLAGRQTLQGRPESTWNTGQIGQNVAEFDIYTGSFLPNLVGGADPATNTTADVSDKPEGGSVNLATNTVTNVDYRVSSAIPVTVGTAANYNVGDIVTFTNDPLGTPVPVNAVGLADKTDTNQLMTFRIVDITGDTVKVFPKPIAADDGLLSTVEQAYANINTKILSGASMNRVNIDASEKANIFWCKNSVEVTGGDAPIQLLNEFGGMKVISSTMSNGQVMYMAYDGNLENMTFRCRLFTWYGLTNKNPSANGVAVTHV
jgi:hypothetical protein